MLHKQPQAPILLLGLGYSGGPDSLDMCYFQPHSAAWVLAVEHTMVGFYQMNMMEHNMILDILI